MPAHRTHQAPKPPDRTRRRLALQVSGYVPHLPGELAYYSYLSPPHIFLSFESASELADGDGEEPGYWRV